MAPTSKASRRSAKMWDPWVWDPITRKQSLLGGKKLKEARERERQLEEERREERRRQRIRMGADGDIGEEGVGGVGQAGVEGETGNEAKLTGTLRMMQKEVAALLLQEYNAARKFEYVRRCQFIPPPKDLRQMKWTALLAGTDCVSLVLRDVPLTASEVVKYHKTTDQCAEVVRAVRTKRVRFVPKTPVPERYL
ncbi:hypothetical protein IAT38_003887 [Cryptococcus sp. DSM 104549]